MYTYIIRASDILCIKSSIFFFFFCSQYYHVVKVRFTGIIDATLQDFYGYILYLRVDNYALNIDLFYFFIYFGKKIARVSYVIYIYFFLCSLSISQIFPSLNLNFCFATDNQTMKHANDIKTLILYLKPTS